jgi:hypothetical protein
MTIRCERSFGRTYKRSVSTGNGVETITAHLMASEEDPGDKYLMLGDGEYGTVKLRRAHLDWLIRELPAMREALYTGPSPRTEGPRR